MTENIFEHGGEFCMRGDPEHKPVEWKHYSTLPQDGFCVGYVRDADLQLVRIDGSYSVPAHKFDLIPIPSPPQIVPWESPDDVPDGIWMRFKVNGNLYMLNGIVGGLVRLGGFTVGYHELFEDYEYHTDRRAKGGWQPCGKVVK